MNLLPVLSSQYLSALRMMEQVISLCPEALWNDAQERNRFWHVAYHGLFYTHLYLQPELAAFQPWPKDREGIHGFDRPEDTWPPYTQAELLELCAFLRGEFARVLPLLDYDGPSGFHWLPMSKLELQFYNIRHLMLHTGELADRLGRQGIDVAWVGKSE